MILVTGGTGLVGSHLLYQLSLKNEPIVAIHRKSSNLNAVKHIFSYYTPNFEEFFSKITWKVADVNDITSLQKAFKGVKKVYHAAAVVSFDTKDYRLLRKVNIEGTANMVNLAIDHKIEKFCFVSSIASIGKSINNSPIIEDDEWNAGEKNNGYAISKYGAENEVWRGSQEGLDVVIVNPGVILGAGFWKNGTGKIFDVAYNGFKFYTEGVTGYVDVTDVTKIMVQLMDNPVKNERYILVSENFSFKKLLFAIADNFDKKRPSIKTTPFLNEIAWRLEFIKSKFSGKRVTISKESARASNRKSNYSNKKIIKTLNYEFEPLLNSIKNICENYKQDL